ncbi:MAG: alpha/beta hydrolase, partial [Acidimicrobiales bacterium]|nr:alpha/beta hydrolase [Acidimicrobiales bacterium]
VAFDYDIPKMLKRWNSPTGIKVKHWLNYFHLPAPISSDLPVVLLSGTFDPITPPAYAEAVAELLLNSSVVTQGGRSHGIWIGNDCIQRIVVEFVEGDGDTPATDCADESVPVDWFNPG